MDTNGQVYAAWSKVPLGTIIVPYSEKVFGDHSYEVLTSSRNGIERQAEHFSGKQRHDTDGYNIIPRGYCTYRNRSDDGRFTFNINTIADYGIVSKFYPVFSFKNANSAFMIEYLNGSPRVRAKLAVLAVGTSQVVLSFETLKNTSFYVPSHKEQDRIAALITLINDKIEKQRRLVSCLKKYKRGLHKTIFAEISTSGCEKVRLSDIATICGGGTPSKGIPSYWDGKIGWISSSDIQDEWIDTISVTRWISESAVANSATKLCPVGTIAIVSRVGVGKVALMDEELCTSQDFTNITSIKGNARFMAYQIAYLMKIEAAKTQGTSIKGITAETIKSLELDMPALIEQEYYANLLAGFDKHLKVEISKLESLNKMKFALLQQLFI